MFSLKNLTAVNCIIVVFLLTLANMAAAQTDQVTDDESPTPKTGGGSGVYDSEVIGTNEQDDSGDEGFLGVGVKFNWDNYKTPIMSYAAPYAIEDDTLYQPYVQQFTTSDYGNPHFAGYFNWGIKDQLVLSAAVDFGFFSHSVFPDVDGEIGEVKVKFFQFGGLLNLKYLFVKPEAKQVSLYISLGVGKYFAKAKADSIFVGNDDAPHVEPNYEMLSKLASPFIVEAAVGAEFFATDNFSIGADILGLRMAYAKASNGPVGGLDNDDPSEQVSWSGEQKYLNLHIFSALVMNFNLTTGKSSKTSDTEAAPADDDSDKKWAPDESNDGGWETPGQEDGGTDSAEQNEGSDGENAGQKSNAAKPKKAKSKRTAKKPRKMRRKKSGTPPPPPPAGP